MADNNYQWTVADSMLEERIDSLKEQNETDNAFCKRCGLDPGNFGRFRKHQLRPGATYLRRISTVCKVSRRWLELGEGSKDDAQYIAAEPIPQHPAYIVSDSLNPTTPETDLEIEILRTENKALKDTFQTMQNMMQTMRDILAQNQKVLEQNAESLSQNRALMSFLTELIKKQNQA